MLQIPTKTGISLAGDGDEDDCPDDELFSWYSEWIALVFFVSDITSNKKIYYSIILQCYINITIICIIDAGANCCPLLCTYFLLSTCI